MLLSFVLLLFIFLISIFQYRLDYDVYDKRTSGYKSTKRLLLWLMIIAVLLTAGLQYSDERNKNKLTVEVSRLHSQNDSLITLVDSHQN